MLRHLVFGGNIQAYVTHGKRIETRQLTANGVWTIKHFSGQTVWDDSLKIKICTIFAAHRKYVDNARFLMIYDDNL